MDKELIDWANIDEDNTKDKVPQGFTRNSARSTQHNVQLDSWMLSYDQKKIQLPNIQRCYEWPLSKQEAWIESLLINCPIPALMIAFEPNSTDQYLIDGYQRTHTLWRYMHDEFKTSDNLPEELKQCRNKLWSELPKKDREFVEQLTINILKVEAEKRHWRYVFIKINSNQASLKPAAIWRVSTDAKLMNMLDSYADKDAWVSVYGRNDKYRGLHALLKALAFHFHGAKYQHPLNSFIDQFVGSMNDYKYKEDLIIKRLNQIVLALHQGPGKMAFRLKEPKKSPLPSLVDCMITCGFRVISANPQVTTAKLGIALEKIRDELVTKHSELLIRHTSKTENVLARYQLCKDLAEKHGKKIQ